MLWWAKVVHEGKESSHDRQSDNCKRCTTNVDCPALRNDGFAGLTTHADIVNVENRRSLVLASLRFLFAKNRVNECYRDVSPTITDEECLCD